MVDQVAVVQIHKADTFLRQTMEAVMPLVEWFLTQHLPLCVLSSGRKLQCSWQCTI